MQVTKEQSMAYTEVIEVLKYMSKEDVYKIPRDLIEYYKANMDNSYTFKIDDSKSFDEQILMEKTKVVLAILFRDYWATEKQKDLIKKKEQYDTYKEELAKSQKYDVNNIFEKKEEHIEETQNKALVEYKKETWYTKFLNFMQKIFKKKKK